MKILKQMLFVAVVVIGFSMTAMAQRQDGDKKPPPPKKDPPQIVSPDKKPKEEKPKNDNRNNNKGKKPQFLFISSGNQTEISSVYIIINLAP